MVVTDDAMGGAATSSRCVWGDRDGGGPTGQVRTRTRPVVLQAGLIRSGWGRAGRSGSQSGSPRRWSQLPERAGSMDWSRCSEEAVLLQRSPRRCLIARPCLQRRRARARGPRRVAVQQARQAQARPAATPRHVPVEARLAKLGAPGGTARLWGSGLVTEPLTRCSRRTRGTRGTRTAPGDSGAGPRLVLLRLDSSWARRRGLGNCARPGRSVLCAPRPRGTAQRPWRWRGEPRGPL